jgi:hypothetical protein
MEQKEISPHRNIMHKAAAITGLATIRIPFGITQNPPVHVPVPSLCSRNVNVLSLLRRPAGSPPNPKEGGEVHYLNST